MTDPRTDAERRYDSERDGSLYFPRADDYTAYLADLLRRIEDYYMREDERAVWLWIADQLPEEEEEG